MGSDLYNGNINWSIKHKQQLKCMIRAGKTSVSLLLLYNFVSKKARCMFMKNTKHSISNILLIIYVSLTSSHVLKYPFNNFFYYLESVAFSLAN